MVLLWALRCRISCSSSRTLSPRKILAERAQLDPQPAQAVLVLEMALERKPLLTLLEKMLTLSCKGFARLGSAFTLLLRFLSTVCSRSVQDHIFAASSLSRLQLQISFIIMLLCLMQEMCSLAMFVITNPCAHTNSSMCTCTLMYAIVN